MRTDSSGVSAETILLPTSVREKGRDFEINPVDLSVAGMLTEERLLFAPSK